MAARRQQIMELLHPYRKQLLLGLILTGLLTVIGMMPPLLMRHLLNDVARDGNWGIFPLIIGLLVAVPVLRAAVNLGTSVALNVANRRIIGDIRKRIFAHLMRLSMPYFDSTPPGAINQRIMGDVGMIATLVTGGLISVLADLVAVCFAVIVMLKLSFPLSGLTFLLLPLYYLNYRYFSKRIQENTMVLRSRMDHISSMLQERLSAHEMIQSYGQEKAESTAFSSQAKQIMDAAVKGSAYSISFNQLSAFINKLGNTLIYVGGCWLFIRGSMEYGDVVAFGAYATQLLGPVVRFSGVANQLVQAGVSIDRVDEILHQKAAIAHNPDGLPVAALQGDVEIRGLRFHYEKGKVVLDGVGLKVPAGTHIAIAGTPGSGRSTLAMMLRRFYDPREGEIRIDDKDIREYRIREYRRAFAMVMPESAIFDGTIRNNLCYGKPDATEERMLEVSRAVGLHRFVESLADGYDSRLGSGGLQLSGGDRQRIGIARALLADPQILILDDATATFDPESAAEIQKAIEQAMEGRTCLTIIHSLLLAKDAEGVAVMDAGKVVEQGDHDELLSWKGSLYRKLFASQYGDDRLPPAKPRKP